MRRVHPVLLSLLSTILVLAGCASTTPAATPTSTPAGPGCTAVDAPAPKNADVAEPTGSLAADRAYVVQLETSCGRIEIQLDQARHPRTANAFAHLVGEGYYNGTAFHRVVPGFVIQGGDPEGNGRGGPSWKVTEAPAPDTRYVRGVVAMAKGGAEPAGTAGSQFFIVTGEDAGLPPDYAVAGRVSAGQDVVDLIDGQGTPGADGPPQQPVVISSATLTER